MRKRIYEIIADCILCIITAAYTHEIQPQYKARRAARQRQCNKGHQKTPHPRRFFFSFSVHGRIPSPYGPAAVIP